MYEKSLVNVLWRGKIKSTQKIIHLLNSLSDTQLDFRSDEQEWSIRSNLLFIIFLDRALEFSLPFSLNLSALLQFRQLEIQEIEQELSKLSIEHPGAVFMSDLENIHIVSATEIEIQTGSRLFTETLQSWKDSLISIEETLNKINKNTEFSQRLVSIKGLHSLPAGLELYLVYSQKLMREGIMKQISNPKFPTEVNQ